MAKIWRLLLAAPGFGARARQRLHDRPRIGAPARKPRVRGARAEEEGKAGDKHHRSLAAHGSSFGGAFIRHRGSALRTFHTLMKPARGWGTLRRCTFRAATSRHALRRVGVVALLLEARLANGHAKSLDPLLAGGPCGLTPPPPALGRLSAAHHGGRSAARVRLVVLHPHQLAATSTRGQGGVQLRLHHVRAGPCAPLPRARARAPRAPLLSAQRPRVAAMTLRVRCSQLHVWASGGPVAPPARVRVPAGARARAGAQGGRREG